MDYILSGEYLSENRMSKSHLSEISNEEKGRKRRIVQDIQDLSPFWIPRRAHVINTRVKVYI